MRRSAIHDMNEMNERVRILDGSIGSIDKQLKRLLEERVTGLAILDAGRTGGARRAGIPIIRRCTMRGKASSPRR